MLGREPALLLNFIASVIALAVGFGADLSTAQVGLLMAAVNTAVALIVRPQTTPLIDPRDAQGNTLVPKVDGQ